MCHADAPRFRSQPVSLTPSTPVEKLSFSSQSSVEKVFKSLYPESYKRLRRPPRRRVFITEDREGEELTEEEKKEREELAKDMRKEMREIKLR